MSKPDILKSQETFNLALDRLDASVTKELASRWLGVERRLASDAFLLANDLSNGGKPVKQEQLAKMRRYVRLMAQVQVEIGKFNGTAAVDISALQQTSTFAGISNASQYINEVYQLQAGVNGVFDRLGKEAVQNIIALSMKGQPLEALLSNAYPLAAQGMTNEIIEGVAKGQNPRNVAKNMLRKGMAQGLNHVLLVSRDQMVRSYREASRQQYDKSAVVTGYRRLAAKNDRTCAACLALDGAIYSTDQLMEIHPQDRCTMIPLIKGFEPLKLQTGEQWFKKQSTSVQKNILGPGKLDAYKKGLFKFSQLAMLKNHKVWGPSTQVTPLKDLLK